VRQIPKQRIGTDGIDDLPGSPPKVWLLVFLHDGLPRGQTEVIMIDVSPWPDPPGMNIPYQEFWGTCKL
jgi:hypothetical protein